MEIVDVHPILDQYQEPWRDLFFSGASINPAAVMGMLAERVTMATHGWRTIEEYLNKGVDLRKHDNGLLMQAPASIVNIAIGVLSERGISTSVLDSITHQTRLHAVIMDKNLVVAEGFRFEARNAA